MIRVALLIFAFFAILSSVSATFDDQSFETCLKNDSISCLQLQICKKLREILSQDRIDLLGGFRIFRNKTLEEKSAIDDFLKVNDIAQERAILEDFIFEKLKGFFKERRLEWNMAVAAEQIASTAKRLIEIIPQNVRDKMVTILNEGRGKKKKWFIPMIIALKTKFFTLVKVVFAGVAFLAKKALVMSIIAFTIVIFLVFKTHDTKEYIHPHYEIHGEAFHTAVPYYAPPVNWQPIQHAGYDTYDLHSSPSHHLFYTSK